MKGNEEEMIRSVGMTVGKKTLLPLVLVWSTLHRDEANPAQSMRPGESCGW